jgi:sn-glycerol 3-phosphate transport system ATP-binding protein
MGSPPMNLLKNAPNADFGGPAGAILGIRPEHLQIAGSGWAVQVDTIEMLGAERLVYGHLDGEPLIVRMDESLPSPALGATLHVMPRPERLHWFDSASGQRLEPGA